MHTVFDHDNLESTRPVMSNPRPVALVTGAARRIGAAIATTLHRAGYNIALHYRDSSREAATVQNALEADRPHSTVLLRADLANVEQAASLVERAAIRFGRLDALVNNASAFLPTPLAEATPSRWDALFDVNAKAPFFLAQAAAFHLRQSHGAIVNITDIYADHPLEDHGLYSISKAALAMVTKVLAQELGPEVRVNAVAPGAILWPEKQASDPANQASLIERAALKRTGNPADIAEAVRYLLQDAKFTTGQTLRVDGGRGLSI